MKSKSDLFELIQSLDKNEKRYFKIFAQNLGSKATNYIRLFDAIAKQHEYNERKIKQKFKGETFIKQLGVTKNYLYKWILRSLENYHNSNTTEQSLLSYQKQIRVLIHKNLLEQALTLIEQATDLAKKHYKTSFVLDLLLLKDTVHRKLKFKGFSKKQIDYSYQESIDYLERYKNEISYALLRSKVLANVFLKGFQEENNLILQELMENVAMQTAPQNQTALAQIYYFFTQSYIYFSCREFEQALVAYQHIFKLFEEHPILKKEQLEIYSVAITNTMIVARSTKNNGLVASTIKKAEAIKHQVPISAQLSLKIMICINQLYLARIAGDRLAIDKSIDNLKTIIDTHQNLIDSANHIYLKGILTFAYFITEQYPKAWDCIDELWEKEERGKYPMLYRGLHILKILILYELDEDLMLPNTIQSTIRFLEKNGALLKPEKLF
ncbi:MAG: hypothetical protein GY810_18790 [Aureispira sp.]|nr:hypothetical protein [Aureispira sp.]